MIPKIIHYCWFGHGEKPRLAQKCISSWQEQCPDFEIIEWNEENFEIDKYPYAKFCYENKKWAFLSDFVRLEVICQYGGVYFDTDVELVKPLDELLEYEAFFGFEDDKHVATGLGFGAVPGHITVKNMRQQYMNMETDEKGEYLLVTCPALNTEAVLPLGVQLNGKVQVVEDAIFLPREYLNPYDDPTGKLRKTQNTIAIHWYAKSWLDKKTIIRSMLTKPFHRMFGNNCFEWLKR